MGAITIMAIAIAWAAVAATHMTPGMCEGGDYCVDGAVDRCLDWLAPPAFVFGGIFIGMPCGAVAGALVGVIAGRLRAGRVIVVLGLAAMLSVIPTWVTVHAPPGRNNMPWRELLPHATAASLAAALVLERWTRRRSRVPDAFARQSQATVRRA